VEIHVDGSDDGRTFSSTTHFSQQNIKSNELTFDKDTKTSEAVSKEELYLSIHCFVITAAMARASTPDSIECSAQPFDLSFHPQRQYLVAAALVDGTVEVHDFSSPPTVGAEDDENDTIVSSLDVHPQHGSKNVSCRTVRFSNDGGRIYAGTSAGDVCAFDAERACTLSSTTTPPPPGMLWKIPTGSHGIHVMHHLSPEYGGMLVTGDEQGCVSLWDERAVARQKPALTWNEMKITFRGWIIMTIRSLRVLQIVH
jgi:WD40 repeat protein